MYEFIEWLLTVKSDGSIAIDDLRLCDAKIRLYLIGFVFLLSNIVIFCNIR